MVVSGENATVFARFSPRSDEIIAAANPQEKMPPPPLKRWKKNETFVRFLGLSNRLFFFWFFGCPYPPLGSFSLLADSKFHLFVPVAEQFLELSKMSSLRKKNIHLLFHGFLRILDYWTYFQPLLVTFELTQWGERLKFISISYKRLSWSYNIFNVSFWNQILIYFWVSIFCGLT